MRFIPILALSVFVSCTSQAPKKISSNDKLLRGTTITFEKRITIENRFKTLPFHKQTRKQVKHISLSLVKTQEIAGLREKGRSIASTCDFVKFCKLSVPKLKPGQHAEVYGEYAVLADGVHTNNHIKSWTLLNNHGEEIKLTCGIQAETQDRSCKDKLGRIKIRELDHFIEKLLEVKVAAN